VTAPGRHDELVARNAAMRDRVDTMIQTLQQRTGEMAQAQAEAVAVQGEARSADGSVTVRTNAAGVPTALELGDDVFTGTTPAKLAALVLRTTQDAARSARARAQAVLGPFTTGSAFLGQGTEPEELVPGVHLVAPGIPEPGEAPSVSRAGDDEDWDGDASVLRDGR
jgi:DNA-binding protein YbaB